MTFKELEQTLYSLRYEGVEKDGYRDGDLYNHLMECDIRDCIIGVEKVISARNKIKTELLIERDLKP